eukprot:378053-Rhodomonas_salina.1
MEEVDPNQVKTHRYQPAVPLSCAQYKLQYSEYHTRYQCECRTYSPSASTTTVVYTVLTRAYGTTHPSTAVCVCAYGCQYYQHALTYAYALAVPVLTRAYGATSGEQMKAPEGIVSNGQFTGTCPYCPAHVSLLSYARDPIFLRPSSCCPTHVTPLCNERY